MKAIILAAGTGARLGEVAKTIPKCLIRVGQRTIAEHQIEALKANNVTDISIVVGYYSDKVKKLLENAGVKFYLNQNYETTGMLESLFCAKEELNDEVIVLYGDVVLKADLIKRLLENKDDFCLVVDREKEVIPEAQNAFEAYHGQKLQKGSTKVQIVEGVVKKISKSLPPEEISAEYIGIAKFSRKAAELISMRIADLIGSGEIQKYPSPSYLFRWLIDSGKAIHVVYADKLLYAEIDYEDDLEIAKKKFG